MAVDEPELEELYREVLLDHYRNPRNRGRLAQPSARAHGYNPLCGDEVILELEVRDGVVTDVRFQGQGCFISQASASLMTEALKGLRPDEVTALANMFKGMMFGSGAIDFEVLGDLEALQGVSRFPVRVKCATLAWNALQEALAKLKDSPS